MKIHSIIPSLFLIVSGSLSAATTITLDSEPGDYIGQGQSYSYTDENADIQYSRNYDNGITVRINNLPGQSSDWWTLNLAAPDNAELQPGAYENAERFPFQSLGVPGLDFSGNGRGCNTLTGRFEVFQVSYDGSGNVLSLSADFEQHCEGGNAALRGTIVYNTVPPLGGSMKGLEVKRVTCRNRTSGQKILFNTTSDTFDCKEEGLQVNPGDLIDIRV
ncbi:MAG: hypothetical protein P8166_07495, partial [Candidatus Thiodiazotropha sp.]